MVDPNQMLQGIPQAQPMVDPKMMQGFGMAAPPQDSLGLIKLIMPLLTPDQIQYLTAIMQTPQEFQMMNPALGLQPQATIQPTPQAPQPPAQQVPPPMAPQPAAPAPQAIAPQQPMQAQPTAEMPSMPSALGPMPQPMQPSQPKPNDMGMKLAQDSLSELSKAALAPRLNASGGSTSGTSSGGPMFS
jgi:hypothetical protein